MTKTGCLLARQGNGVERSAPGSLHLRVWLDGFTAFSCAARRHPRHTITLAKQRFHVLMAAESETHGFNFLQNTPGYKNQCRRAIWLTVLGAFPSPKMARNGWRGLVSPKSPPAQPSPGTALALMRCEAPAVFLERGRCLLRRTLPAAISARFRLSALSSFAQPLPPHSHQGELILAADRDPCLKVDRG